MCLEKSILGNVSLEEALVQLLLTPSNSQNWKNRKQFIFLSYLPKMESQTHFSHKMAALRKCPRISMKSSLFSEEKLKNVDDHSY